VIKTGVNHQSNKGFMNPPLYRGSTVLYSNLSEMKHTADDSLKRTEPHYARFGTPTTRCFEEAMMELENGHDATLTSSGLAAITTAIQAFVKSGDHILVSDSVYYPTRRFCESLKNFNIETEYFDPRLNAGIEGLFRSNTRLVFLESPGSNTFELTDVPLVARLCQQYKIISLIDNTWATPLNFKPLTRGVNVSIHSATKYLNGHSDGLLGVIISDQDHYKAIRESVIRLGQCGNSEEAYQALKGLRTLDIRLRQQSQSALKIAQFFKSHDLIEDVLHPALSSGPDHAIWARDFQGSNGLLSVIFKDQATQDQIHEFIESLRLFGLGHSWGGIESLVVPVDLNYRKFGSFNPAKPVIRFHIGLEAVEDLIEDLNQALKKIRP